MLNSYIKVYLCLNDISAIVRVKDRNKYPHAIGDFHVIK